MTATKSHHRHMPQNLISLPVLLDALTDAANYRREHAEQCATSRHPCPDHQEDLAKAAAYEAVRRALKAKAKAVQS